MHVNDLDYLRKPEVIYERIPKDPSDKDGPTIRVGKVMTHSHLLQNGQDPKHAKGRPEIHANYLIFRSD